MDKKDHILEQTLVQQQSSIMSDFGPPTIKRQRMTPPLSERVMLYVRQDNEDIFTPLHVVPPTTIGLLNAVSYEFYNFFHFYTPCILYVPRKDVVEVHLGAKSAFW